MDTILSMLPSAVIVGCEVVALVLIIGRAAGVPRTLGAVGLVILILHSIESAVYLMLLPQLYDRFGVGMLSFWSTLHSSAGTAASLLGMTMVGVAVILAGRGSAS